MDDKGFNTKAKYPHGDEILGKRIIRPIWEVVIKAMVIIVLKQARRGYINIVYNESQYK